MESDLLRPVQEYSDQRHQEHHTLRTNQRIHNIDKARSGAVEQGICPEQQLRIRCLKQHKLIKPDRLNQKTDLAKGRKPQGVRGKRRSTQDSFEWSSRR